MSLLCPFSGCSRPTAKVVDNTLVLSLPDAKNPLVWRLDLRQVTSSAFEVRQDGDGYTLILRGSEKDVRDIAPFSSRKKAVRALMAAGRALEDAQTQNDLIAAPKKGRAGRWVAGILLLGVILFFFNVLTSPAIRMATINSTPATGEQGSAPSGVPVPADEFLKGR